MTNEEAIEAIKCNWPDSRYTILREALDMAISALRQQWISVKDRLPDQTYPAQKVLFITKTGGLFIGCYYKATAYDQFNGWYSMCVRIDNVTHWMPLPEPPEEDDHA